MEILAGFIIPLIIGAGLRFLLRKSDKAVVLTLFAVVVAIILCYAATFITIRGNEVGTVLMVAAVGFAIGTLGVGLGIRAWRSYDKLPTRAEPLYKVMNESRMRQEQMRRQQEEQDGQ